MKVGLEKRYDIRRADDVLYIKSLHFCCQDMMIRILISRTLYIQVNDSHNYNNDLGYVCIEKDQSEMIKHCYTCGKEVQFSLIESCCDK